MSLAAYYNAVSKGATVTFRPRGSSMTGIINDKDEVVVIPCDHSKLEVGMAVLCKVKGKIYLHKITIIDLSKKRCQISNNHGSINGWSSFDNIVGVVTKVNDKII